MSAQKCVHCGLINFVDAEICKRCGQPPTNVTPVQFDKSLVICPKCSSADTKSFQMAYSTQTEFGSGTGISESLVAKIIQPPPEPQPIQMPFDIGVGVVAVMFIIGAPILAYFAAQISTNLAIIVFLIIAVVGVAATLRMEQNRSRTQEDETLTIDTANEQLQNVYQRALAEWRRNWICLRCGAYWRI